MSTPNLLVVRSDFPGELACVLARDLWEGREALARVHPTALSITPEYTLAHASIPLHPGVARCLEEAGHPVPGGLPPGP